MVSKVHPSTCEIAKVTGSHESLPPSARPFKFFDLPRELRDIVYGALFGSEGGFIRQWHRVGSEQPTFKSDRQIAQLSELRVDTDEDEGSDTNRGTGTGLDESIFNVSRQMRDEASIAFLKLLDIYFLKWSDLEDFHQTAIKKWNGPGPDILTLVRQVSLPFPDKDFLAESQSDDREAQSQWKWPDKGLTLLNSLPNLRCLSFCLDRNLDTVEDLKAFQSLQLKPPGLRRKWIVCLAQDPKGKDDTVQRDQFGVPWQWEDIRNTFYQEGWTLMELCRDKRGTFLTGEIWMKD